ncbi:MAG: DUF177 domain-containing protein [Cytophagales bacterium]|nr:DUF177 domain-containing protein [Cytophagales bacterium]MDW8383500.1 DUF177 domain-containing protein [Flammeovirgaceae bacterium]
MENIKLISLEIGGLENGKYEYAYQINKSLLDKYQNDMIEDCCLSLSIKVNKTSFSITATISLEGTLTLVCDRSLDMFEEPFDQQHQIVFKFGNSWEEVTEDMYIIPFDQTELVFDQIVYDIICTSLPIKKLHPRFRQHQQESDTFFFYQTDASTIEDSEERIDPRWNLLKKLNLN